MKIVTWLMIFWSGFAGASENACPRAFASSSHAYVRLVGKLLEQRSLSVSDVERLIKSEAPVSPVLRENLPGRVNFEQAFQKMLPSRTDWASACEDLAELVKGKQHERVRETENRKSTAPIFGGVKLDGFNGGLGAGQLRILSTHFENDTHYTLFATDARLYLRSRDIDGRVETQDLIKEKSNNPGQIARLVHRDGRRLLYFTDSAHSEAQKEHFSVVDWTDFKNPRYIELPPMGYGHLEGPVESGGRVYFLAERNTVRKTFFGKREDGELLVIDATVPEDLRIQSSGRINGRARGINFQSVNDTLLVTSMEHREGPLGGSLQRVVTVWPEESKGQELMRGPVENLVVQKFMGAGKEWGLLRDNYANDKLLDLSGDGQGTEMIDLPPKLTEGKKRSEVFAFSNGVNFQNRDLVVTLTHNTARLFDVSRLPTVVQVGESFEVNADLYSGFPKLWTDGERLMLITHEKNGNSHATGVSDIAGLINGAKPLHIQILSDLAKNVTLYKEPRTGNIFTYVHSSPSSIDRVQVFGPVP